MQERRVPSLGGEDPLEKEMATHSVFLPGKSMDRWAWLGTVLGGPKRVGHDLVIKQQQQHQFIDYFYI